jgi:hypothetical protein
MHVKQKAGNMSELVPTRVLEICPGEWIVQFAGGLNGWTTFSDTFVTEADALAFEQQQINSADLGDEE